MSLSSLDSLILARGQNLIALTDVRFLHAVARSKISVDKLLGCQILHPLGDLQPESDEILYGRVLKIKIIKIQQKKYVTHWVVSRQLYENRPVQSNNAFPYFECLLILSVLFFVAAVAGFFFFLMLYN